MLHLVEAADGRTLATQTWGAEDGSPVLALHGSPGSRLGRYPWPEHLEAAGIRLVTYDRPGYGRSDRDPGRSVADCVPDVRSVLDALDVHRTGVVGGSGGGPHALALATLLADRCTVVHVVSGVAPYGPADLAWEHGMDPENVRRFRAARRGPDALAAELAPDLAGIVERVRADPATFLGPMALPEADREVLRRLGPHLVEGVVESARQGPAGWVDDFSAFVRPWGFDPADARAPVVLSYGRLDVNVPAGHGDWLASRLPPGTDVRVDPSAGHMAAPEVALARYSEIIRTTTGRPAPPGGR